MDRQIVKTGTLFPNQPISAFGLYDLQHRGLSHVLGKLAGGADSWFSLCVATVQPTELMKLVVLLYVADYALRKQALMLSGCTSLSEPVQPPPQTAGAVQLSKGKLQVFAQSV